VIRVLFFDAGKPCFALPSLLEKPTRELRPPMDGEVMRRSLKKDFGWLGKKDEKREPVPMEL